MMCHLVTGCQQVVQIEIAGNQHEQYINLSSSLQCWAPRSMPARLSMLSCLHNTVLVNGYNLAKYNIAGAGINSSGIYYKDLMQ